MIELSISVPEVREFIKEIVEAPEKVFEMVRFNVQRAVGRYLSLLMELELTLCWVASPMKGPGSLSIIEMGLTIVDLLLRGLVGSQSAFPGTATGSFGLRSCIEASNTKRSSGRICR